MNVKNNPKIIRKPPLNRNNSERPAPTGSRPDPEGQQTYYEKGSGSNGARDTQSCSQPAKMSGEKHLVRSNLKVNLKPSLIESWAEQRFNHTFLSQQEEMKNWSTSGSLHFFNPNQADNIVLDIPGPGLKHPLPQQPMAKKASCPNACILSWWSPTTAWPSIITSYSSLPSKMWHQKRSTGGRQTCSALAAVRWVKYLQPWALTLA